MKHIIVPDDPRRKLPFFLALEEWVAENFYSAGTTADDGDDGCFFTWQVSPTVIFGRNQSMACEVDLDYCRAHDIEVYRRKSGGGCVFADRSNVMFSYITRRPGADIATIFASYTARIVAMLRHLGVDARASGRNDVTIDARKVSGNAFYHTPAGASIVHGTMLFDTDMSHIARAITPSRSKLESKQVKSVESRVTMLSRYLPGMSVDDFRRRAIELLSTGEYRLADDAIARVEQLSRPYYQKSWIEGRCHHGRDSRERCRRQRIEGVGEIEAFITLADDGTIAALNLQGDFFPTADIDRMVIAPLLGTLYRPREVEQAIRHLDIPGAIAGLSNEQLFNLII